MILNPWRFIWGRKTEIERGLLSSRRRPGPIAAGGRCYERCLHHIAKTRDHAVWVPAPVRNCALGRDDDVFSATATPPRQSTRPECPFAPAGRFRLPRKRPTSC